MKNSTEKILLIDGTALLYRSFYAFFNKPLRNSKRKNIGAIFGVLKTLKYIERIYNSKYIAFCFDAPGKTERVKLYPLYKANRPKIPDELKEQIPDLITILNLLGIKFIEIEGYEADDIIASMVKRYDRNSIIISFDKDFAQLVNERVKMANPSNIGKLLGNEEIREKYGVFPNQIIDYLSLIGDNSDNIPGIPGIGPKTASKLLNEFGSVDNIYINIDKIKEKKLKTNLMEYKDQLLKARNLIKLYSDLNVGDIEFIKRKNIQKEAFLKKMNDLELYSIINDFIQSSQVEMELFKKSDKNSDTIVEKTFDSSILSSQTLGIVMIDSYVGINNGNESKIFKDTDTDIIFGNINGKQIISNNIKEIYKVLLKNRDRISKGDDISIASSLLFGSSKQVNLLNIIRSFTDITDLPDKTCVSIIIKIATEQIFTIYKNLNRELSNHNLKALYSDLELPIAEVLAYMEEKGILIDRNELNIIKSEIDCEIKTVISQCKKYSGDINLNSPKQIMEVLFNKIQLPVVKKTKTGFSTNNETLVKLSRFHPFPSLLIKYREYSKFKTSYLDTFPSFIATDGRIHTNYNQVNVDTGRLSSNNPNLQNIPARSEEGRKLKKIFIAQKGFKLVSFDYSQIELRILAHYSKDFNLIKAFNEGIDIHTNTASLLFQIEPELVSNEMRRKAKVINFGIIYGMSPYGLAKELNIQQREAYRFIEKYFHNFKGVKDWIFEIIEYAKNKGYVKTLGGRIRHIYGINSKNRNEFEFAKRVAVNTPIQGSAAELIKKVMIELFNKYHKRADINMLLQIHDELIFEIDENNMREIENIENVMKNTMELEIPLEVVIGTGNSWYEASK